MKIAVADADRRRAASAAPAPAGAAPAAPVTVAAIPAPASQSGGMLGGLTGGAKNVQKWLHLGGKDPAPPPPWLTPPPIPISPFLRDVPLPPRRDNVHLASLHGAPVPPTRSTAAGSQSDAPAASTAQ